MNWVIVSIIATIWLLLYHTIMTGYQAMTGAPAGSYGSGPGTIAASAASTGSFSTAGNLGVPMSAQDALYASSNFVGQGASSWTDGVEAKYAEDGWIGNP